MKLRNLVFGLHLSSPEDQTTAAPANSREASALTESSKSLRQTRLLKVENLEGCCIEHHESYYKIVNVPPKELTDPRYSIVQVGFEYSSELETRMKPKHGNAESLKQIVSNNHQVTEKISGLKFIIINSEDYRGCRRHIMFIEHILYLDEQFIADYFLVIEEPKTHQHDNTSIIRGSRL